MPRFRIDSIGGLARQLAQFAPHETRAQQIAAAEELLHTLDPARAYPAEFIVYKITGYHPRVASPEGQDLLTGIALQHDLGLLIEIVSDTLNVRTVSLGEPVLTIDDVCERFSVTSKTIQRWRRKGLPARRFIFPDGKKRVGFLVNSVERFLGANREQVQRGTNFSQVGEQERDEILRQARRLALDCRCCAGEISRRIARRVGRSPLTVLHLVRKHDQENPQRAIFSHAAAPIGDEERQRLLRAWRRGESVRSLARRSGRVSTAIYRLIIEDRLGALSKRRVKFFDDPLYHGDDVEQVLAAIEAQEPLAAVASHGEKVEAERLPRDLPPYVQSLCAAPLLGPTRERALFLKFNYRKMLFVQARRKLDPQLARMRDLNRLESLWRSATETKNQIVQANLRLVVSVARKHLRPNLLLTELISDGTVTLMRAVEGFDVHRGHRFSTYATLALMKGFARSVPQMMSSARRSGGAGDALLEGVADRRNAARIERFLSREQVGQMLSRLDPRERKVLSAHYGLDEKAPATYEQVGRRLGLSKERVRQIEQSALAKLRATAAQ